MPHLEYVTEINAPLEDVWKFYDSIESLRQVTPPQTGLRIEGEAAPMAKDVRFTLIISQPPIYLPLRWETIITEYDPPHRFVDEQGKGPFAYWRHEHHFEAAPRGRTIMRDRLTYRPPLGPLGTMADLLFLHHQLDSMFRYRQAQTRRLLEPKP